MTENFELERIQAEEEKKLKLEQKLREARESEYWNRPLNGINGWTVGETIEKLIEQLQAYGQEIDLEKDIDPEGVFNDFNR